jgi:predicted enzyme related to lactoylglutathione lyase
MADEMEKVTGIGGVFLKARDPVKMAEWYKEHLGIDSKDGHVSFYWNEKGQPDGSGQTVWCLFPAETDYFGPSGQPYMINYRVASMDRMLAQLRSRGVALERVEDSEYGRFAWITDPEGNRIELWEPPAK